MCVTKPMAHLFFIGKYRLLYFRVENYKNYLKWLQRGYLFLWVLEKEIWNILWIFTLAIVRVVCFTEETKLLAKSICKTAPKSYSSPQPVYAVEGKLKNKNTLLVIHWVHWEMLVLLCRHYFNNTRCLENYFYPYDVFCLDKIQL